MEILFLSRLIPSEFKEEVTAKMIHTMDNASIALQEKLVTGFDINLGHPVHVLNYLPIFSFPEGYKDPFVKTSFFSHAEGSWDVNLGFCNVKYIKRLLQGGSMRKYLNEWMKTNNGCERAAVAYTPYPEFLEAFRQIKQLDPTVHTCVIVPDLPQYLGLGASKRGSVYRRYNEMNFQKNMQYVDSFVLLTEAMAEALHVNEKPYIVMEGIASLDFPSVEPATKNSEIFTVFYGGTLHKAFGIELLLNAVEKISDQSIRFQLCGIGDTEERIKEMAKRDQRIEYLGQLSREEVLMRMQMADVIINPRPGTEEFTKYSFPSKNLEALSSGVPFIGFKLAGIPNEYDEYINYPKSQNAEGLAEMIMQVKHDLPEYQQKAKAAKQYVEENKAAVAQCGRIISMLQR